MPSASELEALARRRAEYLQTAVEGLPARYALTLARLGMCYEWESSPHFAVKKWNEGRLSCIYSTSAARRIMMNRRVRLANRDGALSAIYSRLQADLEAAGVDFGTLADYHQKQPRKAATGCAAFEKEMRLQEMHRAAGLLALGVPASLLEVAQ